MSSECQEKLSDEIVVKHYFSLLDRGRRINNGNRNYNNNNRYQQPRHQQTPYSHQQNQYGQRQEQFSQQQEQNNEPWDTLPSSMQQPFYMLNQQLNNFQQIPKTVFTIHCGECRPKDEGVRVKISGKVVKRPRTGRFLEIKDMKGCTQLVAMDDKPEIGMKFQSIPADSYISVIGTVQLRPSGFSNKVRIFLLHNLFMSLITFTSPKVDLNRCLRNCS